jgi:hypothetical protein
LFEIRVLDAGAGRPRISSGLFDDPDAAAEAVVAHAAWSGTANFYYTLNPVDRGSAYAQNAGHNALNLNCKTTTKDSDVLERSLYLIDIDPVRPSGTPSSSAERVQARVVTIAVRSFLSDAGWPTPTLVSSGNGYHLLYHADRCRANSGDLKAALGTLAAKFDTDGVKVDTCVHNQSRISRLPGTFNVKGQKTVERPHRLAKVLTFAASTSVLEDQVRALAEIAGDVLVNGGDVSDEERPRRKPNQLAPVRTNAAYKCVMDEAGVHRLISFYSDHLKLARVCRDGNRVIFALAQCPFKGSAHSGQDAGSLKTAILWSPGCVGFKCFSDGCASHTFGQLLRFLLESTERRFNEVIWQPTCFVYGLAA